MVRYKLSFYTWLLWGLAALFYFYEFTLRVSPSAMVPNLMAGFGISASVVGVLSSFYIYSYAPMQLPVGVIVDKYGVKKSLSFASIICGFGALLFAYAPSIELAALGRLIIGGASAFAFISMLFITSHWFPVKNRAFLIGVANSIAMLGASAGTGPLARAIHHFGWRVSIGLLGLFGLVLGVIIYIVVQAGGKEYTVEKEQTGYLKRVVTKKALWINGLVALCFYMTTTTFAGLWGLSFVQTAYGVSKEVAGYAMSMVFLGWLVGGPLTGLWSDFIGKRKKAIRLGIVGALFSLVPVIYFPTIPIALVYVLLFLVGLFSSAELLGFTLAMELSSIRTKASAAAFTNFLISCGDGITQPLVGFLLDSNWKGVLEQGIRSYDLQTYQLALTCLPITLLLAFFLLFFVRES